MPVFPARAATTATAATITSITSVTSTTATAAIFTARFAAPASFAIANRAAGFDFTALLQRRFARQLHSALVVDADAFHPDHLADLGDVFRPINSEIGQLGNVNEAVLARENFDKGAEFFDRNDATVVGLADFDFACVMPPMISFARAMLSPLVA